MVLASETAAVRGVLRAAHDARDELSRRRFDLRKAVSSAQKEMRAAAKAGAEAGVADVAPADAGSKRTTRGQPESPRAAVERDRAELLQVEAQLEAAAVRLSRHLGRDRQHNDYWCVAREGCGVTEFAGPLMVLCQEYSWPVRVVSFLWYSADSVQDGP